MDAKCYRAGNFVVAVVTAKFQYCLVLLLIFWLAGCSQPRVPSTDSDRAQVTHRANIANFTVPAPVLIEGQGNQLGLDNFTDFVTFHVSYPGMAVGHTLKLRWRGVGDYYSALERVTSVGTLALKVPRAEVLADSGKTARVTVSVGGANVPELVISSPVDISVVPSLPAAVPAPVLQGMSSNGEYAPGAGDASVQVDYPGMTVGDTVGVRWKGRSEWSSPVQRVTAVTPLTFTVPVAEVVKDLDSAAVLTASVGGNGNPLVISRALSVKVVGVSSFLPPPVVDEASGAVLNLNDLGTQMTVVVNAPSIVSGTTARVRIHYGTSFYETRTNYATGPGPLTFNIARSDLTLEKGREITVTSSLGGAGHPSVVVSQPLNLKIIQPTGPEVVASLNQRYSDTTACAGNQPAFYCSGVIARTIDNGNFDPWDPSPSAINLGGTSFSYLRGDNPVRNMYRQAGYVFATQSDAVVLDKAQEILCIYPHDAGTANAARPGRGCGLQPRGAVSNDLSTCSTVGVTSYQTWVDYTRAIPSQAYQCSFSTQSAEQFNLSLQGRRSPTPNLNTAWDEMMIKTWPTGQGKKLPIEAFFYKAGQAASLNDAKVFQSKFKERTKRWVPIVSLTFLQAAPFAYTASDQAVAP